MLDIEMTSAPGGLEIGEVVVLPEPGSLGGCIVFEQNSCTVTILDAQFEGTVLSWRVADIVSGGPQTSMPLDSCVQH